MAGGLVAMDLTGLFRNQPSAAVMRAYGIGNYMLELDGVAVGWIQSFEGGNARGEVLVEPQGANPFAKKHLGGVRFEPVTIDFSGGMNNLFFDWIKTSISGKIQRRNGAIVVADMTYKMVERLEFQNAMITEFGFPALDAAVKDNSYFTVKFTPEFTRRVPGGAGAPVTQPAATKQTGKMLVSNFRLRIQGLEQACARVNRIEAVTIRQKTVGSAVGDQRGYQQAPGGIDFPNLVFTMSETDAAPLYQWADDFIVKGNNGDAQERPGVLELLSADLKTVLFTLNFFNLGVVSVAPAPLPTASDAIRRVKVELYCERIDFDAGPIGSAATQGSATPPPPAKGIPPPPLGAPMRSAPLQGAPGILAPAPLQRQIPKW
jgi:phage tail-like protein